MIQSTPIFQESPRLLVRFTNRAITFAELLQARTTIINFYISKGYITSGALIPRQTFQGSVVIIRVAEGKLERIEVCGTRRLNPNYVRSRLRLATSKPLNRNRLLEALQLLQLNPLIKSIFANLSPSSSPGRNVVEVQVTEVKAFTSITWRYLPMELPV